MAQKKVKLDPEAFSCTICAGLLKDPATIPCGHSYCLSCINNHWDGEDQKGIHSCPQCGETFKPKPVPTKNIVLTELVGDLKDNGFQAAPADHCYAGPEDVACDVCTGRKMKAVKTCLVCLVSYCQNHVNLHCESPAFKKHKLVEPCKNLEENICSHHGEVLKLYCSLHQKCICILCLVDEHEGCKTGSAATERTKKQKELEECRRDFQLGILTRQADVKLLQQEVEAINVSADKAVEDSEEIFTELIRLLQERSSEVKQQIRSQQETEVSRVKDVQEKLEQEITELKRKDAELEQLSITEDHNQFLLNCPVWADVSWPTYFSIFDGIPPGYFENVTEAVSAVKAIVADLICDGWPEISETISKVDVLLSEPELSTREDFLRYAVDITLDPDTAHQEIRLSRGARKALSMGTLQNYPNNTDRFKNPLQVLSRERLTGRSYWEVQWRGRAVDVAVSYSNISRAGGLEKSEFGWNNKSWSLHCHSAGYTFWQNSVHTPVLSPPSYRVGVFLDPKAGSLSFYSVSETMTLLLKIQTTFTQPLHAGLRFPNSRNDTAEFVKLK
ncbi:PREDICTED: tripartite motif-containing protein 16-like [Poecilia mexicana]|uniref:Tripartite motif-containing protein 16-like n=1 Tax=Poecilia mexicana TaxID=48701 RepID=A0A3B3WT25_9TELE|nr:PREDICTED: tripartite motif-containing protein 16-like [Poecilia mexicana]